MRRKRYLRPPEIHRRGFQLFPGALHVGFANGTGVAICASPTDEPIALYSFVDSSFREVWGGWYPVERVVGSFSEILIEAECDWLVPVLESLVNAGRFSVPEIVEVYRQRYGTDPAQE